MGASGSGDCQSNHGYFYELFLARKCPGIGEHSGTGPELYGRAGSPALPLALAYQKATGENRQQDNAFNLKLVVEEIEKQVIQRALERTNGNRIQAAKLLGISRANIYQKMEKYKLLSHDHCL
ncbi:hypothetical protein BR63_16010 [Thermanaerosceptrum fracticalcis]|uniref:DNA binding HTH domain-containing protein n=1 Tax=Thermanaerosceptrum fracticalcis TaxID=1712410 RepID=A0A7G6E6E1_THEFR|nr:hypothetical protein BR63_16010 [Thermanaerosceptrum fracticalcis]